MTGVQTCALPIYSGGLEVTGVTTQKNALGATVLVCAMVLLFDWLERRRAGKSGPRIAPSSLPPVLLALGLWLLALSQSRTSMLALAVPTEPPILVSHVSGHLSAANSAMLKLAGIDAGTPDPNGGVIRRRENSREPNGVLEESASNAVRAKLPPIGLEETLDSLKFAMDYYASNGITTVQDGAVIGAQRPMLDEAARRGLLPLDVVTYHMWTPVMLDLKTFKNSRTYDHGLKHYGISWFSMAARKGKRLFYRSRISNRRRENRLRTSAIRPCRRTP